MNEWTNVIGQKHLKCFFEQQLLKHRQVYKGGRVPLPHMLLELEKGDGQTYLLEQLTNLFFKYDLRPFNSLDRYIEFDLSNASAGNSLLQIKKMFADIQSAAVYSHGFSGVIGIDVTELGNHLGESHKQVFFSNMQEVMQDATVVLYVSPTSKNREKLKKCLLEQLPLTEIPTLPYTSRELAEIALKTLEELGITPEKPKILTTLLATMIEKRSIKTAGEAATFAEQKLVFLADYSKRVPLLKAGTLQEEEDKYYEK